MTRDYIGKCEKAIALHEMGHSKEEPVAGAIEKAVAKPAAKTARKRKVAGKE